MFDTQSLIKYVLEGAAVALAAFYIPSKKANLQEIALIALTAAATFAVLDLFAPAIAAGTRQGAGFGIGYNITNGVEPFEDMADDDCEEEECGTAGSDDIMVPDDDNGADDSDADYTDMVTGDNSADGDADGDDDDDMNDNGNNDNDDDNVNGGTEPFEPFVSGPAPF
jgi:hypothetical protein